MYAPPWRIIGVDNGTSAMGLCCLEYDFSTNIATVVNMHTLKPGENVYDEHPLLLARRGKNAVRRNWILREFKDYLREFSPDVVGVETPFIGGLNTLNNFAPLTLSLESVIDAVYEYSDEEERDIYVERIAPHEAKRAITPPNVKYNGDKEAVLPNIRNNRQINVNGWDLDQQTLDAVDAIALGYTVITRLARF